MTNFNYTIILSDNKDTLDMILPGGESTKILVKDEADQPRKFYLATDLWKALGSDEAKRPDRFLRSEHGKEQMLVRLEKAYKNNELQTLVSEQFKTGLKESLPQWILDHFILSTRGRFGGGTWMDQDLFLTYAMWLSPELHALAVDCLGRFGHIQVAPPEKQAELLVEEARDVETQVTLNHYGEIDFNTLDRKNRAKIIAKVGARLRQMEATARLKDLLRETYGAGADSIIGSIYASLFGILNKNLIGAATKELGESLGISKNTYTRDHLTAPALTALARAEDAICIYLSDCIEEGAVPSITDLLSYAGYEAKRCRNEVVFRGDRDSRVVAENDKVYNSKGGMAGLYFVEAVKEGGIISKYEIKSKN